MGRYQACLLLACAGIAIMTGMLPAAEDPMVYYDMSALGSVNLNDPAARRAYYDESHLVASLQGIVNRATPELFIRYNPGIDDFWWQRMTEAGGWLEGRAVEQPASLEDLLARFSGRFTGAVVWDERVPATSNLASTIAGADDLLCFRYDEAPGSLYQRFVTGGPQIPVIRRLLAEDGSSLFTGTGAIPGTSLPSTGSAKNDAYRWLIEHYVKTGKTNPLRMGYYLDGYWLQSWWAASRTNHTLTNHDFVIARQGVIFDLNVWEDEAAVDDPGQAPGTDLATLKLLLHAAYERFGGNGFIHIAGFVPWAYKYTTHGSAGGTHDPVPSEWHYAEIISCFNGFMDADAIGLSNMANASFFQHYPLEDFYAQNPKPTVESLEAAGILDASGYIIPRRYYAHYCGDYDAAAWLYQKLPSIWTDGARGQLPLTWAFNPNLSERFPLGMEWTRRTRTANDYFCAGDSGAGYINPGYVTTPRPFSGLPSGLAAWETHCQGFYDLWDITLTGFIIDGYARAMDDSVLDAYARFSVGGIVAQKVPLQGMHENMPYLQMRGNLPGSAADAATMIRSQFSGIAPQFLVFRSILQQPSWYVSVENQLQAATGEDARVVDLYTLLWLVREYETHPERYHPYGGAAEVSARPGDYRGIYPICVADGPCMTREAAGEECFLTPTHDPSYYMYFTVDDLFHRPGSGSLELELRYFDAGAGAFILQYDSTDPSAPLDGAYKNAGTVSRGNSGQWKVERFRIEDARFENRQNKGADFRIYSNGDDFLVREVVIRKVPGDTNIRLR